LYSAHCKIQHVKRPAKAGMSEIVKMPTTILASAGKPATHEFLRKFAKSRQNGEKFVKKNKKE
jgi:hypothetical protein